MSGLITLSGLKNVSIPMVCTLIKHPKHGLMLFDVGYSDNFFKASEKMPYRLYRMVTPVSIGETLVEMLARDGIDKNDIKYIFISHFHSDHVSAVDDFPQAKIITAQAGYDYAKKMTGFAAVKKGLLPDLMALFKKRKFEFIEDKKPIKGHKKLYNFITHDIFGDGAMVAVDLPGHARGQHGLYLQDTNLGKMFLVADATWMMSSLAADRTPLPIVALVNDNQKKFVKTFHALHRFYHENKNVTMVPCHCQATFNKLSAKQR